jgi:hypothetical protein
MSTICIKVDVNLIGDINILEKFIFDLLTFSLIFAFSINGRYKYPVFLGDEDGREKEERSQEKN